MNELRELEIDSTLWTTPSKIINLLDFKPEKLSTETKSNSNNNITVHHTIGLVEKIVFVEFGSKWAR